MSKLEMDFWSLLNSVLVRARHLLQQDLDLILGSHCKFDEQLKPRRDTIDLEVKPYVARLEKLLLDIDRLVTMGAFAKPAVPSKVTPSSFREFYRARASVEIGMPHDQIILTFLDLAEEWLDARVAAIEAKYQQQEPGR